MPLRSAPELTFASSNAKPIWFRVHVPAARVLNRHRPNRASKVASVFHPALMSDCAGLEVADVVRRVMHQLHMPDATLMSLLQPFELLLEKVEPLHIGDNR